MEPIVVGQVVEAWNKTPTSPQAPQQEVPKKAASNTGERSLLVAGSRRTHPTDSSHQKVFLLNQKVFSYNKKTIAYNEETDFLKKTIIIIDDDGGEKADDNGQENAADLHHGDKHAATQQALSEVS